MVIIENSAGLAGHSLHRVMASIANGTAWVDTGTQVIGPDPAREFTAGSILAGSLKACVSKKVKGRHRYFHTSDWRVRHEWLKRKGLQHGFEVLSVHCEATQRLLDKGTQVIRLDETRFVFVLQIVDPVAFKAAYVHGISSTARTYGYNFINV